MAAGLLAAALTAAAATPPAAAANTATTVSGAAGGRVAIPVSPSARVHLVATGPGFARLLYQAGERGAVRGTDVADPRGLGVGPLRAYVTAALVGLPPEGQPQLEILEARVAAVEPGERLAADLRDDGPAYLGDPARLRDQRVVPIGFGPGRRADGSAVVYDRVLVEVRFPDPVRQARPSARADGFEPTYRAVVINSEQARAWRLRDARPARRPLQTRQELLPADGMLRLVVRSDGLYRVTGKDLESAGASLAAVDPQRLRVLYGGGSALGLPVRVVPGISLRPVDAVVDDGGDGRFDAQDYLLFYGEAAERWDYNRSLGSYYWRSNAYTRDNVYWIDLQAPQAAERAATRDGAVGRAKAAVVETCRERVHDEDERLILRQLVGINSGYDWYWEEFTGNARNFSVLVEGAVPDSRVDIRLRLWGWQNAEHTFEVLWNADSLGPTRFKGSAPDTISLTTQRGTAEGLNQVGLFHRDRAATRLDWIEIDYLRRLTARGGALSFDWPGPEDGGAQIDTTAGAVAEFRISGFPADGGRPRLFAVQAPFGLQELVDFDYDPQAGTAVFQDWFSGKGRPPRYVAAQASRFKRPAAIARDAQQRLRSQENGAEYVVITHGEFEPAARRLAEWRSVDDRFGPPLTARVVDVQDIYDEFSGGLVDPMAIRSFVAFAVDNWDPAPVFITLLGDGTYDYKNNSGASHTNWIPPYQDGESTYDEWYTRIAGDDDLPDLAIGRLPVQSLEQAQAVVDKIIAYDRTPEVGPWQTRILLVADDLTNPQIPEHYESYFLFDAETMAKGLLPQDLDLTKLYIGAFPVEGRTKPRARDEFIRQFNEGSLILTYLGHGNPEVLAHEQIFLLTRDIDAIDNGQRLPFVYTAASQVGVFDDPARVSIPEAMVNRPRGGAIGWISATRVGFHNSNVVLANLFHLQMYQSGRQHVPVGLALMEAKQLADVSDTFRLNIQRYSLLGDAAQRLSRPLLAVRLDMPTALQALEEVEVDGQVLGRDGQPASDYEGQALVRAFDSAAASQLGGVPYVQMGSPIYRGRVTVAGGRFRTRFRVPKDITYRAREGRVSAYASSASGAGAAFGSLVGLNLEGTAPGAAADEEGPTITLAFLGHAGFRSGDELTARPVLTAVIADPNGINITGETGHDIELRVDDQVTAVTRLYTSQDDYRRGVLEVPLGELEPGGHTIRLKAWDSYNNSSLAEAAFVVTDRAGAPLTELLFHPNPTRDGDGDFTYTLTEPAQRARIQVYALSGRQVDQVEGSTRLGYNQVPWTPAQPLANGTYLYRVQVDLASGGGVAGDGCIQVAR